MNNEEKILAMLEKLTGDVAGLKDDVSGLKSDVSGLKSDVSSLKGDVSSLKGDVSSLKGDVSSLKSDVSSLKSDVSSLKSDMAEVKATLKQHGEMLEELDERSLRTAVTQENQVLPQLRLLSEGHVTLLETLAPKEQVDDLEEDVAIVKNVLTSVSQRVTALEQAAM